MKHLVGFSGGVDSQACAGVVLHKYPHEDVILLNSDAGGNEHPLTTEHIHWYSEHVHPVVMLSPIIADLGTLGTRAGQCRDRRQEYADTDSMTFEVLAYIKGRYPSRKAQFCTEHLKLMPQRRWMLEHEDGLLKDGYCRYAGVRADESALRAKQPEHEWDTFFDCDLYRPILRWTKLEVFAYLKQRGEKINPLYTMGFSRVGCAPCINSGKDDIRNWNARFPEMIDKVREWEQFVGYTFFAPCVPGMEINWIDDVVKWSKTTHGGQQYSLPFVEIDAEQGTCSSKYGLCE